MSLTFYATVDADSIRDYMPDVPYLLPASSFARKGMKAPKLPAHISEVAADCGGFVATMKWGDYKYTPAQYVDWLYTFYPKWAATMDYCCEPEIVAGVGVRDRQNRTTDMAHLFWDTYQDAPWVWSPTVQGWDVEDYVRHAYELRPLITEMQSEYSIDSAFRVGIGTLCRRASVSMIHQVASAVSEVLPGVPLHLWGVKLELLKSSNALPDAVVSVDSAAWNGLFMKGRDLYHRSGLSQREYCYQIALPSYLAKVEAALAKPKQISLF